MSPYFSIIIPTLNEEKNIGNLLKDLKNQSILNFETIVVDGNSDDNTVKLASEYGVNIVETKTRGVANQRNLGASGARGEYLLFMDADNTLKSDFLMNLKIKINGCRPDVFTCYVENKLKSRKEIATANIINFYIQVMYWIKSPGAIGACIGCKRSIFNKSNNFLQNLVPFEDGYFVRNLSKNGYNCVIFDNPKFGYSQRRFEENGYLKTFGKYLSMQIKRKVLKSKVEYVMGGKG